MSGPSLLTHRISAAQARERIHAGALLVCAYENPKQCRSLPVPGAISLQELEARATNVDWNQEIIFFCG